MVAYIPVRHDSFLLCHHHTPVAEAESCVLELYPFLRHIQATFTSSSYGEKTSNRTPLLTIQIFPRCATPLESRQQPPILIFNSVNNRHTQQIQLVNIRKYAHLKIPARSPPTNHDPTTADPDRGSHADRAIAALSGRMSYAARWLWICSDSVFPEGWRASNFTCNFWKWFRLCEITRLRVPHQQT